MLAVDAQVPIGCGGVAVFPGDMVVADADGVVILPAAIAEEVANDALEQDRLEAWIRQCIEAGESIVGVYPPNEETRARYEAWRQTQPG
jgi:regulator of RNase E activity RraA